MCIHIYIDIYINRRESSRVESTPYQNMAPKSTHIWQHWCASSNIHNHHTQICMHMSKFACINMYKYQSKFTHVNIKMHIDVHVAIRMGIATDYRTMRHHSVLFSKKKSSPPSPKYPPAARDAKTGNYHEFWCELALQNKVKQKTFMIGTQSLSGSIYYIVTHYPRTNRHYELSHTKPRTIAHYPQNTTQYKPSNYHTLFTNYHKLWTSTRYPQNITHKWTIQLSHTPRTTITKGYHTLSTNEHELTHTMSYRTLLQTTPTLTNTVSYQTLWHAHTSVSQYRPWPRQLARGRPPLCVCVCVCLCVCVCVCVREREREREREVVFNCTQEQERRRVRKREKDGTSERDRRSNTILDFFLICHVYTYIVMNMWTHIYIYVMWLLHIWQVSLIPRAKSREGQQKILSRVLYILCYAHSFLCLDLIHRLSLCIHLTPILLYCLYITYICRWSKH